MNSFFQRIEWRTLAVAIIFGLIPISFGNYLVERAANKGALSIINEDAVQVMRRVDFAIDRAVGVLQEASELNLAPHCPPSSSSALQRLVTRAWMIKDLDARLGPVESGFACSSAGIRIAASLHEGVHRGADKTIGLQYEPVDGLSLGGLRISYQKAGIGLFSALMPHELMLPDRQSLGHLNDQFVTISFLSGDPLVTLEGRPTQQIEKPLQVTRVSTRYPLLVTVQSYPSVLLRESSQIFLFARIASFFVGLIAGFALYIFIRRRDDDPVVQMHNALDRGEFIPYYQPIMNLQNGSLAGCEVLVRWRRRDGTMVPPGTFIDVAEKSGFIFPMTLELMRIAARDLGPCFYSRPSLKCGFNLCAQHFNSEKIIDDIHEIFDDSALRLNQLYVEVTERDPLEDMDLARQIICRFQESGIRVALDDVGTGHGGMSYLLKLGVNMMKIDKLFIDSVGMSDASGAIIDSLIELARNMNLDVVAEGVETAAQVEELRRRGVAHAQGYFFSQPMPAEHFIKMVEKLAPIESLMEELIVREVPQEKVTKRRFA